MTPTDEFTADSRLAAIFEGFLSSSVSTERPIYGVTADFAGKLGGRIRSERQLLYRSPADDCIGKGIGRSER